MKKIARYIRSNSELLIWVFALISLAIMDPTVEHMSLCPLSWTGLDFCPGCGLGHSIAFLLDGQLNQSLATHPLGWFATGVLSFRIFTLSKRTVRTQNI